MKRIFVISMFTMFIGLIAACAFFYPLEVYNTVNRLRNKTNQQYIEDKTPPLITITSHVNGDFVFTNFTVKGTISDQFGIESATIKLEYDNGTLIKQESISENFSTVFTVGNGDSCVLTVEAIDNYGNTAEKILEFTVVDFALTFISPVLNHGIKIINTNVVTILGAILSGKNDETSIIIVISNDTYLRAITNTNYIKTGMWKQELTNLATGSNYIFAYGLRNTNTLSTPTNDILIIYDNLPPTIEITGPSIDSNFVAFNPIISGEFDGTFSPILDIFISSNGIDFEPVDSVVHNNFTGTWSHSFDYDYAYGYHTNWVYALDTMGHYSTNTNRRIFFSSEMVFVATNGDNTNDGLLRSSPVLSIQKAIDIANASNYTRVLVSEGVYIQGAGLSNSFIGNDYAGINISSISNISLIGGWNSFFSEQTGYSILDGANGATSNKHIIWVEDTTNITIDGFVIRNGDADGASINGGGIYFDNVSYSLITNCIISNNQATRGGGVCIYESSSNTISGTITGNTSDYFGGGVCIYESSSNIISGTITGNTAGTYGGGVGIQTGSHNTIIGTVSGNTANNGCGGGVGIQTGSFNNIIGSVISNTATNHTQPYHGGGGVYLSSGSYNTITATSVVRWNICSGNGGGVYISGLSHIISGNLSDNTAIGNGGGVYIRNGSYITINGNLSGNTAGGGGGVCIWIGTNNTISATISSNTAGSGGGVYDIGGYNTNSATIIGNTAIGNGGGVYISTGSYNTISAIVLGNTAGSGGGGMYIWSSSNNTISGIISDNISVNYGGGVYLGVSSYNTISGNLSGNTAGSYGGGVYNSGSTNTFSGTISGNTVTGLGGGVYNNGSAYWSGTWGSGNTPDNWDGNAWLP